MENKRTIGFQKEALAVAYLKEQGVKILTQNFYFRGGELDIVAQDDAYLCFIEVKYRKTDSYGTPEEAVTAAKKKRMLQGAKVYLYQNRVAADVPCRFDVIAIQTEKITWIKNAFGW